MIFHEVLENKAAEKPKLIVNAQPHQFIVPQFREWYLTLLTRATAKKVLSFEES